MNKHCYDYPRPAVTTDCCIFCYNDELKILLIKRKSDPFKGLWALPGGFLNMDESSEDGALRELEEETGMKNIVPEQLYTFSAVNRDPRGRTISIAYMALVKVSEAIIKAGDDASEAEWKPVSNLPYLAFDHKEIIDYSLRRLKDKIISTPAAFDLLPDKFTFPQLQHLYESVLGKKYDRRNFRKKLLNSGLLIRLSETESGTGHRGAVYFSFNRKKFEKIDTEEFRFF